MLKSRKATAVGMLLGGAALLGIGVAQAADGASAPQCRKDASGYVCVKGFQFAYDDKSGTPSVDSDTKVDTETTTSCSVAAEERVTVERKKSERDRNSTEVRQETTMECSGSTSR